jgi:hypothetical protein
MNSNPLNKTVRLVNNEIMNADPKERKHIAVLLPIKLKI